MRLPKYWAKGSIESGGDGQGSGSFACWGWSDVSLEDARERGRQRAQVVAERVLRGDMGGRYLYGDRPLREAVIEEWRRGDGTTYAAITRNSYGCEVLNTANAMFVDVDIEPVSPWETFKKGVKGLFGKKSGRSPREEQEEAALEKLRKMIGLDRRSGARVYRTFGGLRYLLTHSEVDPVAETTLRAMQILGADPLYVKLCRVQECFRARLTPKPWRCGANALRIPFPWKDPQAEVLVNRWIEDYGKSAKVYATCRLIHQFGSGEMSEEMARVVQVHDEMTGAESLLPLA